MSTATAPKPQAASRSRSQIIVLFIALIVFIMLLFANFAYLNTQSTYDKQYIGHAGELRVLSQRIAKNATEAAAGKAAAFKLLGDARNDFAQRWGYLKKVTRKLACRRRPVRCAPKCGRCRPTGRRCSKTPTPSWPASRPYCRCTRWRRPWPKPCRNCRSSRKRSWISCCNAAPGQPSCLGPTPVAAGRTYPGGGQHGAGGG